MSIELAQRAAAGDIDSSVSTWLASGFQRHLGGADLVAALHLDRASLVRQRNTALIDAANLLDDGCGPWKLAGKLAAAIKRFEMRFLPCFSENKTPPSSEIEKALLRAFSTGQRVTKTQRKLYELLK